MMKYLGTTIKLPTIQVIKGSEGKSRRKKRVKEKKEKLQRRKTMLRGKKGEKQR